MRWLGILCIMLSCSGLGLTKSYAAGQRLGLLKEWQRLLLLMSQEISFHTTLSEVFVYVGNRAGKPYDVFFQNLSRKIKSCEGRAFHELFSEEVDQTLISSSLSKEDLTNIKMLGAMMEGADRSMQETVLERHRQELELSIEELRSILPQQQKLYRSLGILGGIFLGILLL